MRLELDAGNTRIKWRLIADEQVVKRGADLQGQVAEMNGWLAAQKQAIETCWVSSVHQEQNQWIRSQFPQSQFAQSQQDQAGLKNSYADVTRMGVDRWLAMLAAYSTAPDEAHIVIDAGTAITLDVIQDHRHIGGYICPGLHLMKSSLLGNTQQVKAETDWLIGRTPGQTTQACLDHGILDMVCCWLEQQAQVHPKARIWLTGGDAQRLEPLLNRSLVLEPDLVLNGLTVYFSSEL